MPTRILVVEDEEEARSLLVAGLERAGYVAEGAEDGQDALERLDEGWDVIVTDLVMPRRDGLELLKDVRQQLPAALKLVITSFADKENAVQALNAGADHLLEKPFTSQQLAELIARLMEERDDDAAIGALYEKRLATLELTQHEQELVTRVLKGLPNKRIAAVMGIQEQTVKNQLVGIYRKLGIASRTELFHLVFPV